MRRVILLKFEFLYSRRTLKFEDLLRAIAFNISKLLSIYPLASDLKIRYRNVEGYLTILQHTYIIQLLNPFHRNLVTELKKSLMMKK